MSINPTYLTPLWAIRALEAGKPVPLEAPGWGDTESAPCPSCAKPVKRLKAHRDVLFEYGMATAQPHRCGQALDIEDHPRWLALERVNAELDEISRQHYRDATRTDWGPAWDHREGKR